MALTRYVSRAKNLTPRAAGGVIMHFPFNDTKLTQSSRVDDLVARMTLKEKIGQMQNDAPSIPRLGLPAYNWWSEALHGVAFNGIATVFPQAIGMAATWEPRAHPFGG
jgi:beta-glucosidase